MTNFNSCLIVVNNILRELDDNFPKYLSQGLEKLSEILPSIIPTIKNSKNIGWDNHKKKIDIADKETNLSVQILIQPTYKELKEAIIYLTDSENIKEKYIVYVGSHGAGYSSNWLLEDGIFSAHTMLTTLNETSWIEKYSMESASPINILTPKNSAHWNKILSTLKIKETKQDTVRVFSFSSEIPIGEESIFDQEIEDFSKSLYEKFQSMLVNNAVLNCSQNIGTLQLTNKNGSFYIFDEGCGQSSLLALSGFNLLIDTGYKRTPEFWNFLQKLEKIDTLMMTSWNEFNLFGVESLLKFKFDSTENKEELSHPNLNYCVLPIGPNPVKEKEKLDIKSYLEINIEMESHKILRQIKALDIPLLQMSRDAKLNPHQLYFKLGQGCLDAFPLWPCSPETSGYSKRYIEEWEKESKCQPIYFDELVKDNASAFLLIWNGSKVTTESTNEESNLLTRILISSSCHESYLLKSLEEFSKINPVCNTLSGKACEKKIPEKKSNVSEKKSTVPLGDKVSTAKKSPPVIDKNKEVNKDIQNKSAEKKPLSAKVKVLDKKDEKKSETVTQNASEEKVKQSIEKKAAPKTPVTNVTKKPLNDKLDVCEPKKPIKKSLSSEKSSNLAEAKTAKKTVDKISDKKSELQENKIIKKTLLNEKVVDTNDTKKPLKKSVVNDKHSDISDPKKPSKKSLDTEKNGETQEIKKTTKKPLHNEKPIEIHEAKKDLKKPSAGKNSEAEPKKIAKKPLPTDKSSEHDANKSTKKTVSSDKAPISDLKKTLKPVKDEALDHKKVPKRPTSDKVSDKLVSNKKPATAKSDIEPKKAKDTKVISKPVKKSDLVHGDKDNIKVVGEVTINKNDLESDLEKVEVVCQPSISLNTDDTLNNIDTSELLGKIEAIGSDSNHIEDEQLLITGEKYDLQSTPLSDMITDSPEHPKTEEDVEALKTDALSIDQDLLMTNEEFPEDDKAAHFLNDGILECNVKNKVDDNSVGELNEFLVNENLKQYGIYEDGEFEDEHNFGHLDDSHGMHDGISEIEKERINLGNVAGNIDEINESRHQDNILTLDNEEFVSENIDISEDSIKESENEVIQHSPVNENENVHDSNLLLEEINKLEQFEQQNINPDENNKESFESHNEKDEDESKMEIDNEIIQDIIDNKEMLKIDHINEKINEETSDPYLESDENLIDNENTIHGVHELKESEKDCDEQEIVNQNDQIEEVILENSADLENDDLEIQTQLSEHKVSGEYSEEYLNNDFNENAVSNDNLELLEEEVKKEKFDEKEIEKDFEIDSENRIQLQQKYIEESSNEEIENKNNLEVDFQESVNDEKADNANVEEGISSDLNEEHEDNLDEVLHDEYKFRDNVIFDDHNVHKEENAENLHEKNNEEITNEYDIHKNLEEIESGNEMKMQKHQMEEFLNEEIQNTNDLEDDVHDSENNYSDNDHENLKHEVPLEMEAKEFEYPIEIDNIKDITYDDGEDDGKLDINFINKDNFIGNLTENDDIENEDIIHKDYVVQSENEIQLLDENSDVKNEIKFSENNELKNKEFDQGVLDDYSEDNKYLNEDHGDNFEIEKELENSNKDSKNNSIDDQIPEYKLKLEDQKEIHDGNLLEDHPIIDLDFNEENSMKEYKNDFDENNLFTPDFKLQVDENNYSEINDSEKVVFHDLLKDFEPENKIKSDEENLEHLKYNLEDEKIYEKSSEDVESEIEMEKIKPVESFEKDYYHSENEDNGETYAKASEDVESKVEMEEIKPVESFEKDYYHSDNEDIEYKKSDIKESDEEIDDNFKEEIVDNFEKDNCHSDNEDIEYKKSDEVIDDNLKEVDNFEKDNCHSDNEDIEYKKSDIKKSDEEIDDNLKEVDNFEKDNCHSDNEDIEYKKSDIKESNEEIDDNFKDEGVDNSEKDNCHSKNEDNEEIYDKSAEDVESKVEMEEIKPVESFEKDNYHSDNEDIEYKKSDIKESDEEIDDNLKEVDNFEKDNCHSDNEDIEYKKSDEEIDDNLKEVDNFEKDNCHSENEDIGYKESEEKIDDNFKDEVENFEKDNYDSENDDNEENYDKSAEDVESKVEMEEIKPVESFEKDNYHSDNEDIEYKESEAEIDHNFKEEVEKADEIKTDKIDSEEESDDHKSFDDDIESESKISFQETNIFEIEFEKGNKENLKVEDNFSVENVESGDTEVNYFLKEDNKIDSICFGKTEELEENAKEFVEHVKSEIEHEQADESNFSPKPFHDYDTFEDNNESELRSNQNQRDDNQLDIFENNEINSTDVIHPSDSKNDSDIENNDDENDGEMIIHDVENSEEMDYIKECDEKDELSENKNASEDGDSEGIEEKFENGNLQSNILNQHEIEHNSEQLDNDFDDYGNQITTDELENEIVKSHNEEENLESKYDETEVNVPDEKSNRHSSTSLNDENHNSPLDTDIADTNLIERPNSLVVDNFQNLEDLVNVQADSASSENHLETDRIMPDSESNDSDLSVDIVKDHTSDGAKDSEQSTFTQPMSALDDIIEDYSPVSPLLHENTELHTHDLDTTMQESPVEEDTYVGKELDNSHPDKEFDSTNLNITPDILRGLKHLNLSEPTEVEVEQVIEDEEIINYQTSNVLDSDEMSPPETTAAPYGISGRDSVTSGESVHALSPTENIDEEHINKSYKPDHDNLIGSVNGNHHYEQYPESNSTSTSHWNEPLGLPMPTLLNSKPSTKPPADKNSSHITSAKLKSTHATPPKVNGTQSNNVSASAHKATDSHKGVSSPHHSLPPKPSAPKSTGISKSTPTKPAKKPEIIDQSKLPAFYLDVAYIPVDQDGNVTLTRVSEAFFTRIRARQYILPGLEHNFEVLETFLASRKKWAESDNEMEVRLIPIKMTETLRKWAGEHAAELSLLNIKIGAAVEHCSVSLGGDNTMPSIAHRIDF